MPQGDRFQAKLPFDPIEQHVAFHYTDLDLRHTMPTRDPGTASALLLAKVLQRDPRQLLRWRQAGVTMRLVDELCDLLQVHPTELYGRAYYEQWGRIDPVIGEDWPVAA